MTAAIFENLNLNCVFAITTRICRLLHRMKRMHQDHNYFVVLLPDC